MEIIGEYVVCTTHVPVKLKKKHPSETVEKMEVSYNHEGNIVLGVHITYGRETL